MADDKLPESPVSADADMSGIEPPWELFEGMAVTQYGVSQERARAYVNKLRAEYQRQRVLN